MVALNTGILQLGTQPHESVAFVLMWFWKRKWANGPFFSVTES